MPLHPATVHFPIALLFVVLGLCLWQLVYKQVPEVSKLTFYLFALTEFALLMTVLTGRASGLDLSPSPELKEVLNLHEILGYTVVWANGLLVIWMYLRHHRWKRGELVAFAIILTLICGLMTASSHLGGRMVYEFGAGVLNSTP